MSEDEWRPGRELFIPEGVAVSDRSLVVLRQFAEGAGIPFLDAFGAFRASSGGTPLYFSYDMHWTPAGHRLMARELEAFIRGHFIRG